MAFNVIWSTAVLNYTFKAGWEKVEQIHVENNMEAGSQGRIIQQPWAACLLEDLW